jgi:hypothetical protein
MRMKFLLNLLFVISASGAAVVGVPPYMFTNSGAGTVGVIAGANVTELDQRGGNITAYTATDILLGIVNLNTAFVTTGPITDTGVADFSNTSLLYKQNCDGNGGGGPAICGVNAQSSLNDTTITGGTASNAAAVAAAANQMAAVSAAWAGVTGASLDIANGGTVEAVNGNLQTVTISPTGESSFQKTAYVFNISNNGATPSNPITIDGNGTTLVVLNYTGTAALDLSSIVLTGGLTSDEVLLNVTDGGTTTLSDILQFQNGATINADVIVTSGTVNLDLGAVDGRVFLNGSGTSEISSVTAPIDDAAAPEPGSLLLAGLGLLGLGIARSRKRFRCSDQPACSTGYPMGG